MKPNKNGSGAGECFKCHCYSTRLGLTHRIAKMPEKDCVCVWTDMFMLTSMTVQLSLKILVLLSSPYSERMHHPWLLSSPNIYAFIAKYISSNKGNKTSYSVCRMPVLIKTAGPQKHRLPIPTKKKNQNPSKIIQYHPIPKFKVLDVIPKLNQPIEIIHCVGSHRSQLFHGILEKCRVA